MIEAEKLTHYFENTTAAVNLSFKVEQDQVFGLLGLIAAGKTITRRILIGFLAGSKATARVANFEVLQCPLAVKKRSGYLPENPPLYAEMTSYSLLDFIAKIKVIDSRDRKQKINNALEKAGLNDRVNMTVKCRYRRIY